MSGTTPEALFAPAGGWRVRILDLSGGAEDNIVEEIGGFGTLMHANAFASRYVRDSVERCRVRGMTGRQVLDAGDGGWKSAAEVSTFADQPAGREARDWRSIDPRGMEPEELDLGDDDDDGPA